MCEFVLSKKIEPSLLRRFWILAPALFVFSCRTFPELSYSNIVDVLPSESNIIMQIAVPENEKLLEILMQQFGMKAEDLSIMSKRMEELAIGLEVHPSPREGRAARVIFHVVAIGNWPKMVFGELLGSGWTKQGRYRWISHYDLEIMLLSERELIISSGRLDTMLLRAKIAAKNMAVASVGTTAQDVDFAFWITDPDLIQKFLPPLPVRDFTQAIIVDLLGGTLKRVDDDAYSLDMFIHLAKPNFAESMALAMRLGLASQIGETFDFLDYDFLAGLDIEERTTEIVISHNSLSVELLENFLSFDFGLGVGNLDSRN